MNFATFFAQSMKDKTRKIKKGRYKGQPSSIKATKKLQLPGPMFYRNPGNSDAPSASTFAAQG